MPPASIVIQLAVPEDSNDASSSCSAADFGSASEPADCADAQVRQVLWKILPAAGGSFVEWYEFAIYSCVSRYITANFFADGRGGNLGTWAGFAVTFVFRPVGGAFFGVLADRLGRKIAMQVSIALMLATTVAQGCLPSFECCGVGWGWFGLVALMLCRALQGMSAGGELSTAAVYISEISPKESLGFNLSWIAVTGSFGAWAVAALVVCVLESLLGEQAMTMWGWRLPFLTSVVPGALLILSRRYLEETPDFEGMLRQEVDRQGASQLGGATGIAEGRDDPMTELLKHHKWAVLIGSLGTAGTSALGYVPPMYCVQSMAQRDEIPASAALASQLLCFTIAAASVMFVGMLVDAWGACKVFTLALVAGCIVVPAPLIYWWAHVPQDFAVPAVFIGQTVLGLLLALSASVYLWVVELFPVRVRTTGVSVAYNVGNAVFGGLGPLLVDAGGRAISPRSALSAPAAFTMLAGCVSLAGVGLSHSLARQGALRLTHIRASPY